jgi:hypothetical protein
MGKYLMLLSMLVLSSFAMKAQSIEDGLEFYKWNLNRTICDMKVGDSLKFIRNEQKGFKLKKSIAGGVKLQNLNEEKPCDHDLKLFNIKIRVVNAEIVNYEMQVSVNGHKYYFVGGDFANGISFVLKKID